MKWGKGSLLASCKGVPPPPPQGLHEMYIHTCSRHVKLLDFAPFPDTRKQVYKVNLVAKIRQSAYLCVIFHVKHKTVPFLTVLT